MKGFASDNYAGVIPEALAAIAAANDGHARAYGDDPWTTAMQDDVRTAFGREAEAFLVFNGTAANVLCMEALCRPWEGVITPRTSHLHVDEGGAPEAVGIKLIIADTDDGKLTPERAQALVARVGDEHAVQPRVLSIANSTELGTVYSPDDLAALAEVARANDLLLHVDGARLFAAAAGLGVSLAQLTQHVDALSLGGTKAGLLGVEAAVFFGPVDGFKWRRKRRGQLASKMRYASAQLSALLRDDTWRRHAEHANAMAARLAAAVAEVPGVRLTQAVQANAVFAVLPAGVADALTDRFPFYTWDESTGEVRWMCSWDTTEEEVGRFVDALRAVSQEV